MPVEVWIDTRDNEDYLNVVKIWETDFIWVTRIMKITFLFPFQKRSTKIIGNIVFISYLLTSLAATIIRENKMINATMVECIFQLICFFGMILCYLRMIVCNKKIRACAVIMVQMWNSNSQDIQQIMLKTVKNGYHITIFLGVAVVILCTSFGVSTIVIPSFLNWVLPGNHTYEKSLPLHTEIFFSEDEFFYQIFTAKLISIIIFGLLIGALNSFLCIGVAHIIGEIRKLEYILNKMDVEYKVKILVDENEGNKWIYKELENFVKTHFACIEFFNIILDISGLLIFCILLAAVCTVILTVTAVIILMDSDVIGAAKMFFAFFVVMSVISFACIPSQILKNASEDLYFTCYEKNLQHYPVKMRKMLLFVMLRTMKPFVLTAGPTIELNLETCSVIIKSSMSYAATFRSFYTSL